jgi:hypothetical protein
MVVPLLEVLDLCDSTRSIERRNVTSVPTQALTLFNGDFVNRQAEHLAARLEKEATGDAAQIERAWRLALCRPPTGDEVELMQQFLKQESNESTRHAALVQMCRVIFNMNEFVYPN